MIGFRICTRICAIPAIFVLNPTSPNADFFASGSSSEKSLRHAWRKKRTSERTWSGSSLDRFLTLLASSSSSGVYHMTTIEHDTSKIPEHDDARSAAIPKAIADLPPALGWLCHVLQFHCCQFAFIPGGALPISSYQVLACSGSEFRKQYQYLVGRVCW
jgi:hypothetical protein